MSIKRINVPHLLKFEWNAFWQQGHYTQSDILIEFNLIVPAKKKTFSNVTANQRIYFLSFLQLRCSFGELTL